MGKIMMNGIQYGVGGITDADDVKYTSSQTVKGALDEVKAGLTNSTIQTKSSNGLTCSYVVRSGYCYCVVRGTPADTSVTASFTGMPTALLGAYITGGQWGSVTNHVQVWIDASGNTLQVRNYNGTSFNTSISYPVKY